MRVLLIATALLLPALSGQTPDLAAKSKQVRDLMAAERFAEAIPLCEELARALPENPGLQLNLGLALHMAGRYQESLAPLKTALKLDPDALPASLFLGAGYMRLGQPKAAVAPLQKVLKSQPSNIDARTMLADACLFTGQHACAAENYRVLAGPLAAEPRIWFGLGRAYESLAQDAFEKLTAQATGSAWWLALVADARVKQQQYSGAFVLLKEAQAKAPGFRDIYPLLAAVYGGTGHREWADAAIEKEASLPAPACATEKLECGYRAGKYTEVLAATGLAKAPASLYWRVRAANQLATEAFAKLAALPPSQQSHELLAEISRTHGRFKEAVDHWQAALKFAPGDPRLLTALAVDLHSSRDDQAALDVLKRLQALDPNTPEINFMLGDVYLGLQQPEQAVPLLEKAVKLAPAMREARASLSRAYLQAGMGEKAVPHLKEALPVDSDGSLHYQLARAYQSAGQKELADQMLAKYQEIRRNLEAADKEFAAEAEITAP